MLHSRIKRVQNLIRDQIAQILLMELQDPRFRFVTVSSVKVSKDLHRAIVFVSVLEKDETKIRDTMEALARAKGLIKRLLAPRLVLKFMPDIIFEHDSSLHRVERIDQLLHKIHNEQPPEPESNTPKND
jgi:ribosome-binding factor A